MSSEDTNLAVGNSLGLHPTHIEFLNTLIDRFLQAPMQRDENNKYPTALMRVDVSYEEIIRVCTLAVHSFKLQPALLRIRQLPITIIGDIHGQLRDVRLVMEMLGTVDRHSYLFMGDYGDRGLQGIETIVFLLSNKIRYPQRCFMLRGNHEDFNTSMIYGLLDECTNKYGAFGQRVWINIISVFNHMPFAALISDKIFALHGGISPHLRTLNDINKIPRPTVTPLYGLACDLVWSDPNAPHVHREGWSLSGRGISFTFDAKLAERFCQRNSIDLIVRGHQICNDMHGSGHQFNSNKRVLTLFTASDYIHSQNTGAVLTIDPSLIITLTLFRPMTDKRMRRTFASKRKTQDSAQESSTHPALHASVRHSH